jgi:hypothetical protein
MTTPTRRFMSVARLLPAALLMLALATPATAQGLGGLGKKLRGAAGAKSDENAGNADHGTDGKAAPAGTQTVVVDDKTVGQLIAGLKAGRAEREAAAKEDNSIGRYNRDQAAYEAAKAKCEAAHQTLTQRMMADEKFRERYSATADKMIKAQEKQDQKLAAAYGDSAMALIDPSCLVKEPKRPDDYYDAQREIDNRAEQAELKGAGLTRSELAMVKERAWGILQGAPGDASSSEQAAVNTKGAELKQLLGIQQEEPARARKAAPAPAPAPAPTPATQPGASDVQTQTGNCMANNAQKHQKEIEALAQRAQAAQQANDMNTLMAISDSIQKIQMAGCH